MIVHDLHRYPGKNGHVDTLIELPMEGEDRKRIEASPGKRVTNGEIVERVYDIPAADLDKWYEIDAPEADPEDISASEFLAMVEEVL